MADMKLTKTEQKILDWCDRRGSYCVETGIHHRRRYGNREYNAMMKLIGKGMIELVTKVGGMSHRSPGFMEPHYEYLVRKVAK